MQELVPVLSGGTCSGASAARSYRRIPSCEEIQRAWLPLKIYPVSAGVKGGLAGGVAMAVLAALYGLIFYHSVWYPINLLAGSLYAPSATPTVEEMLHFRMGWFLFALAMHITMCLLVGLLYGAMLPLLPRARFFWEESSVHCCGRACSTTSSGTSIRCSISALTGGGSRYRRPAFGIVAGLVVSAAEQSVDGGEPASGPASRHRSARLMEERDGEDKAMNSRCALPHVRLQRIAGACWLLWPGKPTSCRHRAASHRHSRSGRALYSQNCAGCHGADGKLGPAPPIGDPVYLAMVDDNTLRNTISKGRPGTAMSAFAQSEGGMLTEQASRRACAGNAPALGQAQCLTGCDSADLCGQGCAAIRSREQRVYARSAPLPRQRWQGSRQRSAQS
jgi:mono/diheme cytochrome c family protein